MSTKVDDIENENGTSTQVGGSTTSTPGGNTSNTPKIITLRTKPNIPKSGLRNAVIANIEQLPEDQDPAGKTRQVLRLDVRLDDLDSKGNPFVVPKEYNLAGRGVALLAKDMKDWSGRSFFSKEDAGFDASEILGQKVGVEVKNRKQGPKWHTTIESFHPAQTGDEVSQEAANA